jgi:hypothetical protein
MGALTEVGAGASCTTRTGKNAVVRANSVDEAERSPVWAGVLSASRRASSRCQKWKVAGLKFFCWQYAWIVSSL